MDKLSENFKQVIAYELKGFSGENTLQFFWRMQRTNFVLKNLEYIHDQESKKRAIIADVGCGPGIVPTYFVRKGFTILGIDNCKPFIRFAKNRFKKKNLRGNFVVADIDSNNKIFDEKNCSSIICIDAFEHFRKPRTVIENFKRLLGGKGTVILTTPNFGNPIFKLIERLWDYVARTPGWRELHVTRMNLKNLSTLFKAGDFRIKKSGTFLLLSPFISIISRKLARHVAYIETFLLSRLSIGFMIYFIAEI